MVNPIHHEVDVFLVRYPEFFGKSCGLGYYSRDGGLFFQWCQKGGIRGVGVKGWAINQSNTLSDIIMLRLPSSSCGPYTWGGVSYWLRHLEAGSL